MLCPDSTFLSSSEAQNEKCLGSLSIGPTRRHAVFCTFTSRRPLPQSSQLGNNSSGALRSNTRTRTHAHAPLLITSRGTRDSPVPTNSYRSRPSSKHLIKHENKLDLGLTRIRFTAPSNKVSYLIKQASLARFLAPLHRPCWLRPLPKRPLKRGEAQQVRHVALQVRVPF